jgi:hypothetical protein
MNATFLLNQKLLQSLTLCMLCMLGATLITFSQEPAAAAPAVVKELTSQEHEALRKSKTPEEVNKLILENSPDPIIQRLKGSFAVVENHRKTWGGVNKYPGLEKSIMSYRDVAKNLFPADRAEAVSLYENIDALKVKQVQQESNLCSVYSVFHAAQYAYLEAGLTPPTVNYLKNLLTPDELAQARKGGTDFETLLFRLAVKANQETGKTMRLLDLRAPTDPLMLEMVKTQLRNKRVCVASISMSYRASQQPASHAVVIAGFGKEKDGANYWLTFDSNNVSKGGCYKLTGQPFLGEAYCFWFE